MVATLTCRQFEKRIQSLLDSRQELDSDPLIKRHQTECAECSDLLDSYQTLDDSFSGKIPTNIKAPNLQITPEIETQQTNNLTQSLPLLATLITGLILGIIFGASWNSSSKDAAAQPQNEYAVNLSKERNSGFSLNPQTIAPKNRPIESHFDQFLQQFPTINLYYQYTAEISAMRPIQDSFDLAIHWFQTTFFQTNEYQNQPNPTR